ncbi:type II toxin-antitoxin system RelE family toxin [Wolbachia endosymbiont of Rhagoletis cingulata]|uniref:type II toxin-antitoxin system RelE family toxin n=1 Tax=Wolbachia endosymbiont of Rhagoletis cingulata TaxID=1220542 RepID=UPI003AF341B1
MENKLKYDIIYSKNILKKDLPRISKEIRSSIIKAIEERLAVEPMKFGKPLYGNFKGHRRVRVDDYRIVYRVNIMEYKVIIVSIKHRSVVYKQTKLSDLL